MKRFIGAVLTLVAIIDVAHAKAEEWHWERFGNSSYQGQVQLRDDLGVSSNYQRFSGGNGQRLRRLVKLANVIVKDKEAFAAWANPYLLKGVALDFYRPIDKVSGHDVWGVVLWYRRAPLNVETVEQGIALPEKNPPTTVVNQIFAQYYWGLAKNGSAN